MPPNKGGSTWMAGAWTKRLSVRQRPRKRQDAWTSPRVVRPLALVAAPVPLVVGLAWASSAVPACRPIRCAPTGADSYFLVDQIRSAADEERRTVMEVKERLRLLWGKAP